ncbi:MAG: LLM class flavin-dependent oxidoreductase [Egibacteraceae bacterium]
MSAPTPTIPLSVLDLALVGEGQSSRAALEATTEVARTAERLGYTRLWVAEHHNMPAVASTSPPVLMAHLAARTTSIRVGSGGVMLPNHAPLVVAEQFAMLEALHPGRIDLGIGRAPGTDPATAVALRRAPDALGAEDFPTHLAEVMALLGHPAAPPSVGARFAPTPAAETWPQVALLGSSGFSAQLAGMLGLPFAFAHHFSGDNTVPAARLYRSSFRPSPALARPHLIITAGVVVADTQEEADWHAGPARMLLLSLRSGQLRPLPTQAAAAADPQRDLAASLPTSYIVGPLDTALQALGRLGADTAADELMITTTTYGLEERLASLELLAGAWMPHLQQA